MKKITLLSIFLLVSFLPAANGFAQQQQQPRQSPALQPQQSPQDQTQQEQQGSQSGQQLQWAQKSSDILDKKIISKDGKDLGTAEDLIIGKDGKIEYVILSTGGMFGIGGEKVAVPWDKVKSSPNVDQLTAEVTQAEIQKYSDGKKESGETARGDRKESAMPLAQVDSERAKEFMDQKVMGKDGEELGKVTDLFTSQDGKPMYVVVQDESDKLHPVPAQLVRTNPGDKSLSADFDKQAFQSSPSFDEAQISQQQWETEVRGYYQSGQSGRQQPPPPGMGQSGQRQPPPGPPGGQIQNR
jgi:sporulation protein YlmC with PRC-barrel domain